MFSFACFRVPRSIAAGVAAGLVVMLAASGCASSDQGRPGPAVDRVEPDSAGPVPADTTPTEDDVPAQPTTAMPVPVPADTTAAPDVSAVDQVPVVPTTTLTAEPTTPTEPTPTTEPPETVEPSPPTTLAAAEPSPTTAPTTAEPTSTVPAVDTTPTAAPATTPPTTLAPDPTSTVAPTPSGVVPGTGKAPPGVSWFAPPYTVDEPPNPDVTVVSVTHHDATCEGPSVTFNWTLHLSNGDDAQRSWSTPPWSPPPPPLTGTPVRYTEGWYWDRDPVYGVHSLQHFGQNRYTGNCQPLSGNVDHDPGILPPSGYTIAGVVGVLIWVFSSNRTQEGLDLYRELLLAVGSMDTQAQRALFEDLQQYAGPPGGDYRDPSPRGYFLRDWLLENQPRWSCASDRPCRRA